MTEALTGKICPGGISPLTREQAGPSRTGPQTGNWRRKLSAVEIDDLSRRHAGPFDLVLDQAVEEAELVAGIAMAALEQAGAENHEKIGFVQSLPDVDPDLVSGVDRLGVEKDLDPIEHRFAQGLQALVKRLGDIVILRGIRDKHAGRPIGLGFGRRNWRFGYEDGRRKAMAVTDEPADVSGFRRIQGTRVYRVRRGDGAEALPSLFRKAGVQDCACNVGESHAENFPRNCTIIRPCDARACSAH
jgi:hypothetical protein